MNCILARHRNSAAKKRTLMTKKYEAPTLIEVRNALEAIQGNGKVDINPDGNTGLPTSSAGYQADE
jgi:hypothetical protein